MRRAVEGLPIKADYALIDGNICRGFSLPARAVIKGDATSPSIAAASILAKVTRDRMCIELDREYPEYGIAQHKGYGTAALLLGAGRNRKEDVIDPAAGIILHAKTGDAVAKGQVIATLYASREELLDSAEDKLLSSTVIGSEKPADRPLILGVVE